MSVKSPCVKNCTLDKTFSYCVGCFRSEEAITQWSTASDEQKMTFLVDAENRKHDLVGGSVSYQASPLQLSWRHYSGSRITAAVSAYSDSSCL